MPYYHMSELYPTKHAEANQYNNIGISNKKSIFYVRYGRYHLFPLLQIFYERLQSLYEPKIWVTGSL